MTDQAAITPRIVELRRGILKRNDEEARLLRSQFQSAGVFVVNLVSAPGTGKTRFLEETLRTLREQGKAVAAIVGDPETDCDAQRLARSGAPVRQIETRGVCHLEARMVADQLADWSLDGLDYLFIENVGNLVCTTNYDLGEALRVVLVSVAEGEDKPCKYPGLFHSADLLVITKVDLAEACECHLPVLRANLHGVRPGVAILETSAKTGVGMPEWLAFLEAQRQLRQEQR